MSSLGASVSPQPWKKLYIDDIVRETDEYLAYRVLKTWHEIGVDDPELEEAIVESHSSASAQALTKYHRENELERNHIIVVSNGFTNLLAHESAFQLIDRPLDHGFYVKRTPTDLQSGTVVEVGGVYDILHSYSFENGNLAFDTKDVVRNVHAEDLQYAHDWEVGDYVIWNNCWLGEISDVVESVTICLNNKSVVTIEAPGQLKLKRLSNSVESLQTPPTSLQESLAVSSRQTPRSNGLLNLSRGQRLEDWDEADVDEASVFEVGQIVETTKGNLRRGIWRYGTYNPNIEPVGKIVNTTATMLRVNWYCQNMMVSGRFVPVNAPDPWQTDDGDAFSQLRRFKPLADGGDGIKAADFERADRVRFHDINDAISKYNVPIRTEYGNGKINKIPRSETMGYDVNTFMILARRSWVRVLWQDLTVTKENSIDLINCDNIDEHELWPGDFVISQEGTGSRSTLSSNPVHNTHLPTITQHPSSTFTGEDEEPVIFISPEKVGVIQYVDAANRLARVRWYKNPKMELAGEMIVPGSTSGVLEDGPGIDVSMYDVRSHPALGINRGDFVLIAPELSNWDDNDSILAEGESLLPPSLANIPLPTDTDIRVGDSSSSMGAIANALHGIVDAGLIANLSASLSNTTSPQLQTLSRMLGQLPAGMIGDIPMQNETLPQNPDSPADWFGEVIDKSIDGFVTVRLGALDEIRNVKVPIERLTIVFLNGETLDGEGGFYDDDSLADMMSSEESGSDFSMEADDWISEQIFYEGGQRMDVGNEADWLTDEEGDGQDIDEMEIDSAVKAENKPSAATIESDLRIQYPVVNAPTDQMEHSHLDRSSSFTATARQPERFLLLDSPVPSDHAFASQPTMEKSTNFLRRVNKEHHILQTSLPEGIYVRTWDSRIDLVRVLIVGPRNTPYELAPFIFDFYLGQDFPSSPPSGFFHSWTNGIGRVNPNLYEDGKICLSLLGTWHGEKKTENWSSSGSSLLQVLISLMGLVLVKEPYYNEAGFNVYVGAEEATVNSALYSEKAFLLSRGFVKRALQQPVSGFQDVIRYLYDPLAKGGMHLLDEIVGKTREIVRRSEIDVQGTGDLGKSTEPTSDGDGIPRLTVGALVLLKRTLLSLEEMLPDR